MEPVGQHDPDAILEFKVLRKLAAIIEITDYTDGCSGDIKLDCGHEFYLISNIPLEVTKKAELDVFCSQCLEEYLKYEKQRMLEQTALEQKEKTDAANIEGTSDLP